MSPPATSTRRNRPTRRKICSNPAKAAISARAMPELPAPPMLMIDRITEISLDDGEFGKGHVIAELDIAPGLWFFDATFPAIP